MDVVASLIGVSRMTLIRGEYILADATPELISELEKGSKTINGAFTMLKRQERTATQHSPAGAGKEESTEKNEEEKETHTAEKRDVEASTADRSMRKCSFSRREFDMLKVHSTESAEIVFHIGRI